MDLGLMWFDNDKQTDLKAKVIRAADYYRKKYGQVPNRCFVNPRVLVAEMSIGVLEVRADHEILPNHFWLGMEVANDCSNQ